VADFLAATGKVKIVEGKAAVVFDDAESFGGSIEVSVEDPQRCELVTPAIAGGVTGVIVRVYAAAVGHDRYCRQGARRPHKSVAQCLLSH